MCGFDIGDCNAGTVCCMLTVCIAFQLLSIQIKPRRELTMRISVKLATVAAGLLASY